MRLRLASIGLLARRLHAGWPGTDPPPEAALLAGVSGGLDPALVVGDTFAVDTLGDAGGPVGLDPGCMLKAALNRAGLGGSSLWTSPTLVCTPEAKAKLWRETGAAMVDMESATVAREARARGVSIAVVRTVLDAAGQTLPLDFAKLVRGPTDDRIDKRKLLLAILKKPSAVPSLVKLGRANRIAAEAMESAIRRVLQGLAPSQLPPAGNGPFPWTAAR